MSIARFAAALVLALLLAGPAPARAADIGGPFTLTDHHGNAVTEASYPGKYLLVFFGYTYCPEVCPTTLSTMADALDILGDDAVKVRPLFVSVDPERDTPEQLAMYVRHFNPRLIGLTGTAEQVAAAAQVYRVYYRKVEEKGAAADEYLMDHTAIAYLMGPDGAFKVHFSQNVDAETMARRIKEFL